MRLAGRLVEGGHAVRLALAGPRIGRVEALDAAPERWLAPGLLDIQVNGYGGHDANAPDVSPETIARLVRALWRRGVTALCPTVVTQSEGRICRSLAAIAAACAADPLVARAIPRIHVEGPHISPEDGPRGAHPLEHVRPPDLAEYRRWQDAAGGRVGLVTLAPEYPEAPAYISALAADGVVPAIGHTAAGAAQLRAAVDAGARLSTHLGNGAHAQLPRHPNYLWEQLAEDRLAASLIFDGHHLPPAVMRTMLRAKGVERSILVSDAVAAAGLPPGVYASAVGGRVELLPTGRLNLAGTPYLAGSASALPEGIANAVRLAGASLADAVRLAATNPARLLGLAGPGGRGSVRAGGAADLTVFRVERATGDLVVELTVVGGEVVHREGEEPRATAGVRV